MTPTLGCEVARGLLEGFVDGELVIDDQVAVESHLRWCTVCRARVDDMRLIGSALRGGSSAVLPDSKDARQLQIIQDGVLSRLDAEHEQSFQVRLRAMFEDMHFFWPALGASTALGVCLWAVLGMLQTATAQNPQSLSAMLDRLSRPTLGGLAPADPGSNQNPLRLDGRVSFPRGLRTLPVPESSEQGEVAFAVAALVNRDGRISRHDLLRAERNDDELSAVQAEYDESAVLDIVRHSRFRPAEMAGGTKVAVNMVWLLVRTTAYVPTQARQPEIQPVPSPIVAPAAEGTDSPYAAEPDSEPSTDPSPLEPTITPPAVLRSDTLSLSTTA